MYQILYKKRLGQKIILLDLEAPAVAAKAQAGQFVMLRLDEKGERFPLTIAGYDREKGVITVIFQMVGESTVRLGALEVGEGILDVTGPLGQPTHYGSPKRVCVVGGGVGCAIAYPQAKALFDRGVKVDIIAGFRSRDMVILEEEMQVVSSRLYITTDDGSYGYQGFVTDQLKRLIGAGEEYDLVIAIGPLIMMKLISNITKELGIPTIVSLNTIMIDGTGMCGGCRVTVGGEMKFACVDGPDFDGHQVDYDELIIRNSAYREEEQHKCKMLEI